MAERSDTAWEDGLWAETQAAAQTHPHCELDAATWASVLARAQAAAAEARSDPDSLQTADLWLATSLGQGDERALQIFESTLMPEVDRALRRFALSQDEHLELRQRVRIRLLVSQDGTAPPRIATYAGLGRLAPWVRTISARLALNLRRDTRKHAALDEIPEFALPATSEIASLRSEDRSLFVSLLKAAFRELSPADRTLLRLRYAQNMTAVSLARAYGVHESTLSRRLASARKAMADNFRRGAAAHLGVDASTDVFGLVHSRVESSLESLLASVDPE